MPPSNQGGQPVDASGTPPSTEDAQTNQKEQPVPTVTEVLPSNQDGQPIGTSGTPASTEVTQKTDEKPANFNVNLLLANPAKKKVTDDADDRDDENYKDD